MASFTPEELDFIKSHGNEYCRQVWLGLYDNSMSSQTESREENKVKDFMAQKYERKRWYVAPSDSLLDKARKLNEASISKQQTKPLKSLLGENAPRLVINNQKPANAVPPPIQQPATSSPPQTQSPGNQSLQSSKSSGSTAMDLLGDLGGDPFSSPAQSGPPAGGGFADFGNFGGGGGGGGHFPPAGSQPTPFAQMGSAPLQPGGNTGGVTSATSINGAFGPTSSQPGVGGDKYSNLGDLFSVSPPKSETQPAPTGWGTSSSTGSASVNWNSSAPASTGGINWGGESNSSNTGGMNWNSSGGTTAASTVGTGWGAASTGSWNTAPTAQPNGISGLVAGKPGNPFLDASAVNPFGGGGSNTSLTSQSTQGGAPNPMAGAPNPMAANPFGGAPQQQGGFGQFGAPAGTPGSNPGFGQFSSATSTQGQVQGQSGFGQFGMQNGGFGGTQSSAGFGGAQTHTATGFGGQGFGGQQAGGFPQQQHGFGAPAGFGGQPAGGFGGQPAGGFGGQPAGGFGGQPQQMQGFGVPAGGGWGQPGASSTVNPFMSTASQASAPKSGSTNPFL